MFNKLFPALLATALLTGVAQARVSNMVEQPKTPIAAAAKLTQDEIRLAIIRGGAEHGWRSVGEEPGKVTLRLDQGKHSVVVDVVYDADSYQIKYKDSTNMSYEKEGDDVKINGAYSRWMAYLTRSISANLIK